MFARKIHKEVKAVFPLSSSQAGHPDSPLEPLQLHSRPPSILGNHDYKNDFFSKLIIKSCEYIFSAQLFLFLINPSCEKTENVKRSRILQEFCIDFC